MSIVEQQVSRAQTRLTINVFFERATLAVVIAAGLWALIWVVERMFVFGLPMGPSVMAAGGLAILITLVGTVRSRVTQLQAAVTIDEAAGLKERLSTALTCRAAADEDPFVRAALHDAEKVGAAIHVPTHVRYRAPRLWPWSIATVTTAVLIGFFMKPMHLFAGADPADSADLRAAKKEQREIAVEFNKRLDKIRDLAAKNPDLKDLEADLDALEMLDKPLETPDDVRRDAVKRIDKIADKLAEQKNSQEMDALKEMKRMMAKLRPQQGKDLASQLSQALAAGDFKGARKALDEMKELLDQVAKSGDPKARKAAAEMKKKLDALARQLAKLGDKKQLQKELEKKAGLSPEAAKKLLEQLAGMDPKQVEKELQKQLGDKGLSQQQLKELAKKIVANEKASQACQSLAQCLSQAAKSAAQGNAGGANSAMASALGDAGAQLSDLEMAEQFLNELEAELAELQDLRDGVCEGNGLGLKPSDKIGSQGPNRGLGYGSRIGKERVAHGYQPSKIKSQIRGGQIIAQLLVDGPQIKGKAEAEVREAFNAAERDMTDPVERDEVPRQYERTVRRYFESLAGLLSENTPAEKPAKSKSD